MTKRSNGEGTLDQRPDGRWRARIRYEDPVTAEPKRATFYGRTKTEARQKMKAAIARLEEGAPVKDAKATVGTWLAQWRETSLKASNRADKTKATYATLCKGHLEPAPFGAITLDRLRPSDIEKLILELKDKDLSESTVRQIYTILRQALSDAKRDGLIARNAAEAVPRPAVTPKEARFLSPAEVNRLLKAAESSRYHALLAFIAGTGVRKGEALATKWSDLDLEKRLYRVPGTKSESSRRTIPLSPALVALLKQHRKTQAAERLKAASVWRESDLVFTTEAGTAVNPRNALRALTVAAKAAKLENVNVHTLRHSAATAWIQGGASLKTASQLLGHSDISITGNIYAHVPEESEREAIDALSAALGL